VVLENGREADLWPAERARGAHGVEDIRELEVVVAPEANKIVFGSVEHFLLVRIGEQGRKRTEIRDHDRIDDVISGGRGELNKTDALAVSVKAVGFGIDGHHRTGGECADEPAEAVWIGNENGWRQRERAHTQHSIPFD